MPSGWRKKDNEGLEFQFRIFYADRSPMSSPRRQKGKWKESLPSFVMLLSRAYHLHNDRESTRREKGQEFKEEEDTREKSGVSFGNSRSLQFVLCLWRILEADALYDSHCYDNVNVASGFPDNKRIPGTRNINKINAMDITAAGKHHKVISGFSIRAHYNRMEYECSTIKARKMRKTFNTKSRRRSENSARRILISHCQYDRESLLPCIANKSHKIDGIPQFRSRSTIFFNGMSNFSRWGERTFYDYLFIASCKALCHYMYIYIYIST